MRKFSTYIFLSALNDLIFKYLCLLSLAIIFQFIILYYLLHAQVNVSTPSVIAGLVINNLFNL
jgi:hypothetical protein